VIRSLSPSLPPSLCPDRQRLKASQGRADTSRFISWGASEGSKFPFSQLQKSRTAFPAVPASIFEHSCGRRRDPALKIRNPLALQMRAANFRTAIGLPERRRVTPDLCDI